MTYYRLERQCRLNKQHQRTNKRQHYNTKNCSAGEQQSHTKGTHMNDTISITEAAKRFSVSQETVKRWLRKEKLEGYKDEGKWYVKTNNDNFEQQLTHRCVSDEHHNEQEKEKKDEIKKLFDLLEGKDMQITSLTNQNESLSQQLDRLSQLLLISHKSIQDLTSQNQLLIETSQQKKPSLWQRLIGQKI